MSNQLLRQAPSGAHKAWLLESLFCGTGAGKRAIGITRIIIRTSRKARFFKAVDIVSKLK